MKKVKIRVEGIVQGVGFRYSTKILADRIHVYGIVKNLNDGSVYIEANGKPENIDHFIKEVRNSPSPSASVDKIFVEEDESIEERVKFIITNWNDYLIPV